MEFAVFSDMKIALKFDLSKITDFKITTQMFTDSSTLFDILSKAGCTTEIRMIMDLHCVKHAYDKREIGMSCTPKAISIQQIV